MFLQFYWPKIDPNTFHSYPSGVPYVQQMSIKRPYRTFGSLVDVPNETQSVQIGLKWTSILDLQGTPCMVSGHPLGPHQTSTRRLLDVHQMSYLTGMLPGRHFRFPSDAIFDNIGKYPISSVTNFWLEIEKHQWVELRT